MHTVTAEQAQRLFELAAVYRDGNGRLKYPQRRPRFMKGLRSEDYEDIALDALLRCIHPPKKRNRKPIDREPPPALANRLRACGRQWDPVRYFWHSRLKEAYRKFRRNQERTIKSVSLDTMIASNFTNKFVFAIDRGHCTASSPIETAEVWDQLTDSLEDIERKIAELVSAGYSATDISRKSHATLYHIKNVRAHLQRECELVERETSELRNPILERGCSLTPPAETSDDANEPLAEIDRAIGELTEKPSLLPKDFRASMAPTREETQEIRDAVRNIEARKAEVLRRPEMFDEQQGHILAQSKLPKPALLRCRRVPKPRELEIKLTA